MKKNKNIFFVRLSHNFLNNAWNNLKFWVSSLFMLVYQSLKFQGNWKHGVLNPSDLPWNTPYIDLFRFILDLLEPHHFKKGHKRVSMWNRPWNQIIFRIDYFWFWFFDFDFAKFSDHNSPFLIKKVIILYFSEKNIDQCFSKKLKWIDL